jgi:hypothetical protein
MNVKYVESFSDSLLVVQQVVGVFQWFDGPLNAYLNKYLEIIALFDDFTVQHVSRDENAVVNDLVQQASDFWSNRGKFSFLEKNECSGYQTRQSGFWPMCSVTIYSAGPNSVNLDDPISETGWSGIYMILDEASETTMTDPDYWRTPLVRYLENHCHIADRKVRRQALKYVMLDNTLYRWIKDDLLLKCLVRTNLR